MTRRMEDSNGASIIGVLHKGRGRVKQTSMNYVHIHVPFPIRPMPPPSFWMCVKYFILQNSQWYCNSKQQKMQGKFRSQSL